MPAEAKRGGVAVEWSDCFPAGSKVLALPSWRRPRFYFSPRGPVGRWRDSELYPAFRSLARGYRFLQRAKATAGLARSRVVESNGWALGQFIGELLPPIGSIAVLVGTPGPTQKTTIQFRDAGGRVTGYLKYSHTERAKEK